MTGYLISALLHTLLRRMADQNALGGDNTESLIYDAQR